VGKRNNKSYKMMNISHKQAQLIISFIVVLVIIIFYYPIAFAPNSYMFSVGDDGLANYFTLAYYLQANGEILNCSAMNYPFGESIFYHDMMPGLAVLLSMLKPVFPNIALYSVGIINYLIFISWLFSALLFFELYRFYRIPKLAAILASVGIIFLSPQIDRIFYGHYALALTIFFPWILWLCLRFFEKKRTIAGFSIFFLNIGALFIHAYIGVATALITFCFALFYIEKQNLLKSSAKVLLSILPLCIYFVINKLCDHHTMREVHTWGYFYFNANINSFFVQRGGFLHPHFSLQPSAEGDAYIGIFACLAILLLIGYFIKEVIVKKSIVKTNLLLDEKSLKIILFIGIIGALIAISLPFWGSFKKYIDLFPLIKQFRSIGRFAWIFYYCITFLAPVIVYRFLQKISVNKQITSIIFCGLLFIPIVEATSKQIWAKNHTYSHNCLNQKYLSDVERLMLENIEADNYQAIIPIPYFHNGSNCYFKIEHIDYIVRLNNMASFYKKLPSFGVRLSRTSLMDTRIIGSIFLPPYCERAISNYINTEKPLLIIVDKTKPLLFYEKGLLAQAELFYENAQIALYNLSPSVFYNIDNSYADQSNLVTPIYYESFCDHDKGVLSLPPWARYTVFDSRNAAIEYDSLYRLSLWTYIGEDDRAFKNDVILSYYNENNELIKQEYLKTGVGMLMYDDWGRIDYLFSLSENQYFITEVSSIGVQSYFDDVMLQKESENTVIENDSGEILYNNFKLKK